MATNDPRSIPPTSVPDKNAGKSGGLESPLDKLAAAEARIKELEARVADAENSNATSGLKINPQDRPFCGDSGGWKFRVGPRQSEKYPGLPIREMAACDESEIKRWYCASHDWPVGSRRALDPVAIDIVVECIDERRARFVFHKAKLSKIRSKLEQGQQLTEDEYKLLNEHESEIQGVKL